MSPSSELGYARESGDSLHDRRSVLRRLVEGGVEGGHERRADADGIPHDALVRLVEEVGLPTLRVDVSVRTEERREGTDLVPPGHHLGRRVSEEAANIG